MLKNFCRCAAEASNGSTTAVLRYGFVNVGRAPVAPRNGWRLSGGLNSVPYWYRCDTVVCVLRYGFVNIGRASVAPRNGSSALRWPIVIFQVLSRRSSADFLAVVDFVLRFSPGEVHR